MKKATEHQAGVQRNAGRAGKGNGARNGIGGDGTTTTPVGEQQSPREARSAANCAGHGNTATRNPAAHGHRYL